MSGVLVGAQIKVLIFSYDSILFVQCHLIRGNDKEHDQIIELFFIMSISLENIFVTFKI